MLLLLSWIMQHRTWIIMLWQGPKWEDKFCHTFALCHSRFIVHQTLVDGGKCTRALHGQMPDFRASGNSNVWVHLASQAKSCQLQVTMMSMERSITIINYTSRHVVGWSGTTKPVEVDQIDGLPHSDSHPGSWSISMVLFHITAYNNDHASVIQNPFMRGYQSLADRKIPFGHPRWQSPIFHNSITAITNIIDHLDMLRIWLVQCNCKIVSH